VLIESSPVLVRKLGIAVNLAPPRRLTSILKMIEWRWGLAPLTVRDETATNLAEVLQFDAPDLQAKQFAVAAGPFGSLCVPGLPDPTDERWLPLLHMAADSGWPLVSSQPV
jgi:phospholipase C